MLRRPPAQRGPEGLAVHQRDGEPKPGPETPNPTPEIDLDTLHQPDAACHHCGRRTSIIDNICLRCRAWHRY